MKTKTKTKRNSRKTVNFSYPNLSSTCTTAIFCTSPAWRPDEVRTRSTRRSHLIPISQLTKRFFCKERVCKTNACKLMCDRVLFFVHELFAVGPQQNEHFLYEIFERFQRFLPQQQTFPFVAIPLLVLFRRRDVDVQFGRLVMLCGDIAVRRNRLLAAFVCGHFVAESLQLKQQTNVSKKQKKAQRTTETNKQTNKTCSLLFTHTKNVFLQHTQIYDDGIFWHF